MPSSVFVAAAGHENWLTRRVRDVDLAGLALKALRIFLFYAALVGLWQLLFQLHIWKPYLLPGPQDVWESLRHYVDNGLLAKAIRGSMERLVIGYGISIILGLIIGMLCGSNKYVDETVGGLVLGLQSLPSVCWLPLALIWFGLNDKAIIFVAFMGSFCAIAISARAGRLAIPPLYRRAAATMGASRYDTIRHVLLPAMVPSMAQGLKLGWSFAWRSLMAAELLNGGKISLGQLLETGRGINDMSLVLMVMLVIMAIGLIVDRLVFSRLEGWVLDRWGLART